MSVAQNTGIRKIVRQLVVAAVACTAVAAGAAFAVSPDSAPVTPTPSPVSRTTTAGRSPRRTRPPAPRTEPVSSDIQAAIPQP